MATRNPFDLLDADDIGDPSALLDSLAAPKDKPAAAAAKKQQPAVAASAKLPSKPLPPAQAVRESRPSPNDGGRGRGGARGGRGFGNRESQEFGRGRGGSYNGERNVNRENNAYSGPRGGFYESNSDLIPSRHEDGEGASNDRGRGGGGGGRLGGRGGRSNRGAYGGRGGFGDEAGGDDSRRRAYERRSGSGRGPEMKREGSGRGNWGTPVDQGAFQETEEVIAAEEEKTTVEEKPDTENNQETPAVNEEKKEEEEDKEMTLDEYEIVREEKRKALLALKKVEERKVDVKEFESMQVLSNKKKDEDAMFIKLGPEKEKIKKIDAAENERVRKAVSINEFLKPAEGERYYSGGRVRGRGRGERGGFRGGYSGAYSNYPEAPSIEDPRQFPTLGGK